MQQRFLSISKRKKIETYYLIWLYAMINSVKPEIKKGSLRNYSVGT